MEYSTFVKAKDLINTINELHEFRCWIDDGSVMIPQRDISHMFTCLHKNYRDIYTEIMLFIKEEITKELDNKEIELKSL